MNPAPMPAITALYAGLAGLLLVVLAYLVSLNRRRHRVSFGDGNNRELQRAIRVHGNAVEWIVPAVLLLLVADLNRADPALLHLCGLAIIVGRILHAIGLWRSSGLSFGRFTGSALSWGAVAVLAIWNLWAFGRLLLV
jgi:uncharacterized membrane protein YecN with MAPEG domain